MWELFVDLLSSVVTCGCQWYLDSDAAGHGPQAPPPPSQPEAATASGCDPDSAEPMAAVHCHSTTSSSGGFLLPVEF